ncbi:MAG: DUF5679 domain-containing protein [Poseidonia sp.]
MRHWPELGLLRTDVPFVNQAAVFLLWKRNNQNLPNISIFYPPTPYLALKNVHFLKYGGKYSNQVPIRKKMSNMSAIEGYCLKCKTQGPIRDGKKIVMKNGRTRMAGFCSQAGCSGKISKIIS